MFTKTSSRRWLLAAAVGLLPALGGCGHNNPPPTDSASATPPAGTPSANSGPLPGAATQPAMSSGGASSDASAASTQNVDIKLFRFKPQQLTVAPGTTVTWTNQDDINHTVTSGTADKPGTPLNGKLATKGSTYSYKFDTPGEYPYFCDFHNSMTGTVIVKQP